MPIYEYRCEQGHTFEVMQRMSDDPVQTCETCEAPVARVFHPVAVHFKGSGFYNTDYGTRKRARETASSDSSKRGQLVVQLRAREVVLGLQVQLGHQEQHDSRGLARERDPRCPRERFPVGAGQRHLHRQHERPPAGQLAGRGP